MKTKILEQLKQRPMRAWAIAWFIGAEEREIVKCLQYLRNVGLVRFDKKVGWVMAQNKDETALARAEAAEARVRELEAMVADRGRERDAAQEAAGSSERRLRELEAEMKECSEVRAKLAVELAEYQLRQPALEAQCAAMRGACACNADVAAIREAAELALDTVGNGGNVDVANALRDALSGDAGRALLERVEALERVADAARKYIDTDATNRRFREEVLSNALDTLETKP